MKRSTMMVIMTGIWAIALLLASNGQIRGSNWLSVGEMRNIRGQSKTKCTREAPCEEALYPDNPRAYDCSETPGNPAIWCMICGDGNGKWIISSDAGVICPGGFEILDNYDQDCGLIMRGTCKVINGVRKSHNPLPPQEPYTSLSYCRPKNYRSQPDDVTNFD